ncbi:hypothetical protein FRC12_006745 [Ceratobasidium sp. 428]|nr:hypothetical protein FRC12_006745 [Ceratobasidium sp. 428]
MALATWGVDPSNPGEGLVRWRQQAGGRRCLRQGHLHRLVDSEIEYTHLALGSEPGPDNNIIGGYEFAGDAYAEKLGRNQTTGHYYRQSIQSVRCSGLAYKLTLIACRIFGCVYHDEQDFLSLGGAEGWSDGVLAVAASEIASQGKAISIAAGIDGHYGSWYAWILSRLVALTIPS